MPGRGRADEIAATLSRVEAELAEWRSRHRDAERELSKLSRDLRRRGTDVDRAHDAYEKARARLDGLRHPGTGPPTR